MKEIKIEQLRTNVEDNAFVIRMMCPTVIDALNLKSVFQPACNRGDVSITVISQEGNLLIQPRGEAL